MPRLNLGHKHPLRRWSVALAIALAASALAWVASVIAPLNGSIQGIDTALYDSFYKRRPIESKLDSPVVIIAVDQSSLDAMAKTMEYNWPWPRDVWGQLATYLQKCGARGVVFDLTFEDPSNYRRQLDDDKEFAAALDQLSIPVIQSTMASSDSAPRFAVPTTRPVRFGAVNVVEERVVRTYRPFVDKTPSLAVAMVRAIGETIPAWANDKFRLHFYGPTNREEGGPVFRYVPAYESILLAQPGAAAKIQGLSADTFRGKIVLIGATVDATFDLKSSPYSTLFPGVEAHATAICNMLEHRFVHVIGAGPTILAGLLGALFAAAGTVVPRGAGQKLLTPLASAAALFAVGYLLFTSGYIIHWLPLASPLLAVALATVSGLSWTYLVEDRQRRILLKFLAQYVSPEVAAELDRRGEISLGGVRREMTALFTDIAGFTDVTEQMEVEQLEKFMNFYLSEMSGIVFAENGTLDKYIGDAVMTFWNAPLDQPDHAARACRTALGMQKRENEIRPRLIAMGAGAICTRIGINTGPMVVGNMGSLQKLNYTVMGNSVNLASRLEGANKIYGSQILVAQSTVDLVKGQFLFRQLDLLRVKGKKIPTAVYELMAEGAGNEDQRHLAERFGAALAAYQNQNWDQAEQILVELRDEFPQDEPSAMLLKRVHDFRANPPPPDWDGVHVAKDK